MKFIYSTSLGLLIGLLSTYALFAQNNSQITGCRLQITDSRKTASLSEDQTDQQTKITEDYELRVAN
ncbi:MAG TPA: hypothetical protein VJK54_10070, partial [Chthoniobacterales bacterium]|nr:hypothetical protein [Chthoniobacterales bacterium]